jgi:hypothetical protein
MENEDRAETVAFRWVAHALILQLDLREDCLPELLRELHRERALVRRFLLERAGLKPGSVPPLEFVRRA